METIDKLPLHQNFPTNFSCILTDQCDLFGIVEIGHGLGLVCC